MKEIELLKTIFKDSPDILEPLNEIDKEIERINKGLEYIELYWSNREEYEKNELLRQIRDKDTSIEWLERAIEEEKNVKDYIEALREIKKENKDFKIALSRKEVLELVNEFDRLNNIINELEKYLIEYSQDLEFRCYANTFLDKLRELKGSDKE